MTTPADLDVTLLAPRIQLTPLQREHAAALLAAAADGGLWNLRVTVVPGPQTIDGYIDKALADRTAGQVLGSTRFWKIDRDNRKLEIGHTWPAASAQGTGVNAEMKYALLDYAFEVVTCVRVQFTTDELNAKSRAAILAIGAVQERIVRHKRIMPDGRKRNSVRFSIIDSKWPAVKAHLLAKMASL